MYMHTQEQFNHEKLQEGAHDTCIKYIITVTIIVVVDDSEAYATSVCFYSPQNNACKHIQPYTICFSVGSELRQP